LGYDISDGLILSQSHYVEKMLKNLSRGENNIVETPMSINIYLSKNKGKGIDQLKYSQIIETLMYVMPAQYG
jgi:hypothetical protein